MLGIPSQPPFRIGGYCRNQSFRAMRPAQTRFDKCVNDQCISSRDACILRLLNRCPCFEFFLGANRWVSRACCQRSRASLLLATFESTKGSLWPSTATAGASHAHRCPIVRLHRGIYSCCEEICLGQSAEKYASMSHWIIKTDTLSTLWIECISSKTMALFRILFLTGTICQPRNSPTTVDASKRWTSVVI